MADPEGTGLGGTGEGENKSVETNEGRLRVGEELEVAYVPIACAAPLLHAAATGMFERRDLAVKLRTAPDWNGIKQLVAHRKVDAAHMLIPLALAAALGLEGPRASVRLCAVQNLNGSALIFAKRHANLAKTRDLRGLVVGVPHRFSMQYYLLCDLLANEGIDPLADVSIVEAPPPMMPRWLASGALDAALCPEPFAQSAVDGGDASVLALSCEVWPGHPCCGLTLSSALLEERPRAARALLEGLIEAAAELARASASRRRHIGRGIARYFGAGVERPLEKALAGEPLEPGRPAGERIRFIPQPFVEHAVWSIAQMQRWGQLAGPIDHHAAALQVLALEPAYEIARAQGFGEERPSLAVAAPFSWDDPFGSIRRLPFCAYRPERPAPRRYELPEKARARLAEILDQLAEVAGGRTELALQVTSDDEIGALERMLNEATHSARIAKEALAHQLELEERSRQQQALIAAQGELIRELGTPVIPVLRGVLLVPVFGRIDAARAEALEGAVLGAVSERGAETVLLDVTGAPALDDAAVDLLSRLGRAVALLGAECVMVGVSSTLARALAGAPSDRPLPRAMRDLEAALGHAQAQR